MAWDQVMDHPNSSQGHPCQNAAQIKEFPKNIYLVRCDVKSYIIIEKVSNLCD